MERLAALLLLAAAPALASDVHAVAPERETFTIIGWGDGCAVAVAQYGYPRVGEAIANDPVSAKLGVLRIPPGSDVEKDQWLLSLHGAWSWKPKEEARIKAQLKKEGYVKPGIVERMGAADVVNRRDLPRLLLTTDTLKAVSSRGYAEDPWKWTQIVYEPIGTCALFLYEDASRDKPFYDYRLVRINSTTARADRALAHVTNGLLLLERGDLPGALTETETAATLAPEYALARYHHAALMSLNGVVEPAVDELEAAIKLDDQYRAKARRDPDFKSLRWHPKFQELTK